MEVERYCSGVVEVGLGTAKPCPPARGFSPVQTHQVVESVCSTPDYNVQNDPLPRKFHGNVRRYCVDLGRKAMDGTETLLDKGWYTGMYIRSGQDIDLAMAWAHNLTCLQP